MNTFVQAISPTFFGGEDAFMRQSSFIAAAARQSPPRGGGPAVRTPGQAALAHKAASVKEGVPLYGDTMELLAKEAAALGVVEVPVPFL